MYPRPPRAKGLPKGRAFPSLTAARDRQPSPAGGRRSALAQTDPPNIFSFPPGAAQKVNCPAGAREAPLEGFLFDVFMRGPHHAPRGGERRSKGAGAVFAAGGNRAERTLRRRQWGAHPAWTMPLREQNSRGQPPAARIYPGGGYLPIIPSSCFQVSTRRQAVSMVSSASAPLATASMTLGICVR